MGNGTRRDNPDFVNGSDLPRGDGTVGDEQVKAIDDGGRKKPTGQDHSLDNYGETMPDGGVGGVQDNSDTTSDLARAPD